MKTLLEAVINSLEQNKPVVMVSVIASSGSTPRGAGALMAVFPDGGFTGTIGGGAVEYEAQKQASTIFTTKNSRLASYTLTKNDVANLGMICGGDVTVSFEYIDASDSRELSVYKKMRALLDENKNSWLIRRFENGLPVETAVCDDEALYFSNKMDFSELKPLLGNSPDLSDGDVRYYTEPLKRAGRVYVFGGGHVAQELVPALARVDFSVVVYEDRDNFSKPELFPGAEFIVKHDFLKISEKLSITQSDYVVVMTRGHQMDFEVLEQTLKTEARYVGCIGSSKKVAATKERLLKSGVTETALARLHSPIGLKIKAETPAEIAVSIAAELIMFRAESVLIG